MNNAPDDTFILGIKWNQSDFPGPFMGAQLGLPLLTPRQPPGNPQETPSEHRINDSYIVPCSVFHVQRCGVL